MVRSSLLCFAMVCAPCAAMFPQTAAAQSFSEALEAAKPILQSRLRYEFVDQDGAAKDANAVTIGTRYGVETGVFAGFKLLLEGETVTALTDTYNSTNNGRTAYAVVSDPEMTELNRAQLTYTAIPDTSVVIGRQRLALGDQRFVGNVGFRQNEQTFDAVSLANTSIKGVTLRYAYIDRVHRVFGDDHPMGEFDSDSHMAAAEFKTPIGAASVYGLLLDFDNAPAQSSDTIGARLSGPIAKHGKTSFRYVAEYARQTDYGRNPASFDLGYARAEIGADRGTFTSAVGVEWLDGDGTVGFSTPLATLHKFQGWADAFLTTPGRGVRDLYASVGASWKPGKLGEQLTGSVVAHSFDDSDGSLDFGEELDAVLTLKVNKHVSFETKLAAYSGGDAGPADRTKFWMSTSLTF